MMVWTLYIYVLPQRTYVTRHYTHDVCWFIILISQHVPTLQLKPSAFIWDHKIRYKLVVGE